MDEPTYQSGQRLGLEISQGPRSVACYIFKPSRYKLEDSLRTNLYESLDKGQLGKRPIQKDANLCQECPSVE